MRYRPKIEWSKKSWTYNVFRLFELIFGRKYGIRAESRAYITDKGEEAHVFYTWESALMFTEHKVREFLKGLQLSPFKVYIPTLQTTSGFQVPASPFLFAIAFPGTAEDNTVGASPRTIASVVVSGSNPMLFVTPNAASANTTAVTFNTTETLTIVDINRNVSSAYIISMWQLGTPTATTANVSMVSTGSLGGCALSYSGCAGTVDSSHGSASAGTTPVNCTTTVVASNCWLVGVWSDDGTNPAAGTGTTQRAQWQGGTGAGDSNGTVSTGSQSLQFTYTGGSGSSGYVVASFAPAATTSVKTAEGLAITSVKTGEGLAIASIKKWLGLA